MKIFVFGNPLVEKDTLPLKLLPKLQSRFPKIDFVTADPTEFLDYQGEEIWILDSAEGVEEVTVLHDISKLDLPKRFSVHDYDVALDLKLLEKLGRLEKVTIIAIPMGIKETEALKQLSPHLQGLTL